MRIRIKSRLGQRVGIMALCLLSPVVMGGCPSVRNEIVNGFEATVRSVLDVGLAALFEDFRANSAN